MSKPKVLDLQTAMLLEAYEAIQRAHPEELPLKMTLTSIRKARRILREDIFVKDDFKITETNEAKPSSLRQRI